MLPCCTCGCAPTASWTKGFVGFLPVLRPPAGSGSASSGGFSSPLWFPPFAMGSPLRGRGSFVLDRNEGLESPYGSGVLVSFLFCATDGCRWCCTLSLCGRASNLCLRLLFAPCHYGCVSWWSSLRARVFGCP